MRHDLAGDLQNLPAEQIKQVVITWLGANDGELTDLEQQLSFEVKSTQVSKKQSKEERLAAFHEWLESHKGQKLPFLSDEAISRESIYEDRI